MEFKGLGGFYGVKPGCRIGALIIRKGLGLLYSKAIFRNPKE